jgi:hypothetical protein
MQRRTSQRKRGITVVWVALTLTVMIMFGGLALDAGYVHVTGHQLQNAADASALAGAAKVGLYRVGVATQQDAINDAVSTAAANQAAQANVQLDAAAGDVVLGSFDRSTAVFTANGTPMNACKVVTRRTTNSPGGALPLLFAPIFGFQTSDVTRQAIAMTGGTLGAGMIALHPTRQGSFTTNGSTVVNVVGGSIQVNSSHSSTATNVTGTAGQIIADQLRIYGGITTSGTPQLPTTYTNTSPVPDPLAGLPSPVKANYTNYGSVNVAGNATQNIQPGYYPGGITMNNGTLNFAPGIYLIGPPGLRANGGAINAPGVMFYFTSGDNGNQYGRLDLAGNVVLTMTPPSSGPWAGVSMFADRTAPYPGNPNAVNSLIGNPASSLSGTLYFPSTPLSIGGTSSQFANQIIASTIEVGGNGTLTVNYDGRNVVEINNVFLVK